MDVHRHSHLWPGVPLALGSAVLFGLSTPLSKLLLGPVDPQLLAGILYLGAGIGLAGIRLVRDAFGVPAAEAPLRKADLPWLALVILFGGMAGPLLLMLGLARTEATFASLLLNLEGLATMAIAWLVFRENVDRRLLLGAMAIIAGAGLLSWGGSGVAIDSGAIFIALACVAWGIDNNLTRKLSSADPVTIAMSKGIAAGTVNVAIALLRGVGMPQGNVILAAAALGFIAVGVSLVLFVSALRQLGAARTGAYFSTAPFVGASIAIAVLHDPVSWQLLLAGCLMGGGVWLHITERHVHEHEHEPLEHEHAHSHDAHHRHSHEGPVTEPHAHWHRHLPMRHKHTHYPDLHHRHPHG